MTDDKFIQKAIAREKQLGHGGMTHDLLSVPRDYNLAEAKTLLEKIVKTPLNERMKNPLVVGKRYYTVDIELKRHANFALNLIRIQEQRNKR